MLKIPLRKLLPLLLTPLILTSCDDNTGTGPGDGSPARVSLLLTDAPGDLEAAVVTITDIYLQGGRDDDRGRIYLRRNNAVTTDLLTLSNDAIELVDDYELPAGRYSQLRFVISGAYIELENSTGGTTIYATSPDYEGLPLGVQADGELKCPSCAQSGFKVLLGHMNGDDGPSYAEGEDDEVYFDGEETILVDFDVSRSFGHQAGNSGKWVMKPTLKATRLLQAAEVHVTLGLGDPDLELPLIGDVPLSLGSFRVSLTPAAGGDPKTATFVGPDDDGRYEASFGYLFPGEYRVDLLGLPGLAFLTEVALPVLVDVAQGDEANLDLRLTQLTLDAAAEAAAGAN